MEIVNGGSKYFYNIRTIWRDVSRGALNFVQCNLFVRDFGMSLRQKDAIVDFHIGRNVTKEFLTDIDIVRRNEILSGSIGNFEFNFAATTSHVYFVQRRCSARFGGG